MARKASKKLEDIWVAYATQLLLDNPEYWSQRAFDIKHYYIYCKVDGLNGGKRVKEVITYNRFRKIVEAYFLRARKAIVAGEALKIGKYVGKICARRVERDFRNDRQRKINWQATKQQKLVFCEDKQALKYERKIYYTDDDWCRIGWEKTGQLTNEPFYEFAPTGSAQGNTLGFKTEFKTALRKDPLLKFQYLFIPIID